ncbi:putative maltooligosyl trehalose synthase [Rhodococcoides trifolii]|uniref:Maltooligosyl trehalose synthase n=1 Tax=Rhodococcoides trifolii TaxID=908250 RepID=A0A917D5V3_9NOCA|nr:malto-oligosyltrehalose synthase [Rhodococcus trifolii]GGG11988.1 putative maltooligosyl trehalose synthase [Rhodococcus trifolii]
MAAITSTYRLQLRGDRFTLADAAAVVDYIHDLGVSHVYLSPILTAAEGSTHGYDVTDPRSVSEALGGRAQFENVVQECRARGMGVVVDIVPNHLGVAVPRDNPFWWDVLKFGRASEYRDWFDIDWAAATIALPVLGSDDDVAELTVDRSTDEAMIAYYDHRFPIDPSTDDGSDDAASLHDRQAYRLVGWKTGQIGYRRFFTVSDLAGVRQEDPAVFDATHTEVRSWFGDGLVDGLRVDHPDGLAAPADYLARLRSVMGADSWLVVEKILTGTEPLDPALPVDGTTGYDALSDLGGVFVDPAGVATLGELSTTFTGNAGDREWLHAAELDIKRTTAQTGLSAEVDRLVAAVARDTGLSLDRSVTRDAVVEIVARMPAYRSDYGPLAGTLAGIVATVVEDRPELSAALTDVAAAISVGGEASVRLQQVAGAVMAKSVEDCLFYRTSRLLSLQEVGGDPAQFGRSVAEFHVRLAERARLWPAAMTTLSTHDTKRGEDVRARIAVLSQIAELWSRCLADWEGVAPSPNGTTGLFLWQNIIGTWPTDGTITDEYRTRLHDYAEKAVREAGLFTSWNDSDEEFESSMHAWIDAVLDGPVAASVTQFVSHLAPHAWSDSLGQKLLHLAGPGIPDIYQGTELWEDSLVDPDNRRDVDYDSRRTLLQSTTSVPTLDASGAAKLWATRHAATLRRDRPASFVGGTYAPVVASGDAAEHLVGFLRGPHGSSGDVIAVASRLTLSMQENGWGDTTVALPEGEWTDVLTSRTHSGTVDVATVFGSLPVALLVR